MIWHSFIFNTYLTGQRSDQSCSEDGIAKGCWKWLSKVLWRNSLCLQIFHPETSIHFAMDLRKAFDTLHHIAWSSDWPNLFHNIVKKPSKYIWESFPFVCKSKYNWPCNTFLQTVASMKFASAEIAFRLPQMLCPNSEGWNETLSLTFFSPFREWSSLEKLGFVDLSPTLEQKSLLPTVLTC